MVQKKLDKKHGKSNLTTIAKYDKMILGGFSLSQHDNQSGRLETKESSHAQRIEGETSFEEYNPSTSVQTLFNKFEGLKDMLNSIRKGELNCNNGALVKELCASFDFIRNDLGIIFNVKPDRIKRILSRNGLKLRNKGSIRKLNFNDSFFENIDSEEKAYFLGFLITDGCVRKRKDKNSYEIKLKLHKKDTAILEKFKKVLGFDGPVKFYKDGTASLSLISKKMYDDLGKLGVVERKTFICYIPEIDTQFNRHLLRGIFDGDGCVGKKQAVLTTGSEKFANDFCDTVSKFGGKVLKYKINNTYKLVLTKKQSNFLEYMYEDCSYVLERKRNSYLSFWKHREVEDKKPLR